MKIVILSVFVAVAVLACAQLGFAQQAGALPKLTSKAYASMKKDEVYVVLFSAPYCGGCHLAQQTLFPALMKKYASEKNVHFYVLDVEEDVAAADGTFLKDKWGILYLPTFVVAYNDAVMYFKSGYSDKMEAALTKEISTQVDSLK